MVEQINLIHGNLEHNFKVDFDKLGKGFVDMLPEDMKNVLSIGMLPNPYYDRFIELFFVGLLKTVFPDTTEAERLHLKGTVDQRQIKDIQKRLTNAIYSHGNLVV